jgi:nicotinate dehydrogenase subunit B
LAQKFSLSVNGQTHIIEAGEPSTRPVAAAIGNAIFDATGVRIRRVPFSPEHVKAALS